MQKDLRVDGTGHRFAARDYYEHIQIGDSSLWQLSDAELADEKQRCLLKLSEAKANVRRLHLLPLLVGIPGLVLVLLCSIQKTVWGFLATLGWIVGTLVLPMHLCSNKAAFERRVIKHYTERLQDIMLIQRDRSTVVLHIDVKDEVKGRSLK